MSPESSSSRSETKVSSYSSYCFERIIVSSDHEFKSCQRKREKKIEQVLGKKVNDSHPTLTYFFLKFPILHELANGYQNDFLIPMTSKLREQMKGTQYRKKGLRKQNK